MPEFTQTSVLMPDAPHLVVVEHDDEGLAIATCLTCDEKHPDTPKHAEAWATKHRETQHYTREFLDL